jgi:TetR/AcrR family transcriptional regulator, cholesterol catabolism regulator
MVRAMVEAARTGVWATHRADLRTRIVEAFMELLETASPTGVSMPAVADRAGISVRTLYRYFPSKDDLQHAAANWLDRGTGREIDLDNIQHQMRLLWRNLAHELRAVRTQHWSAEGRALRIARLPAARHTVDRALPATIRGARRAEVIDLLVAIGSSSMLLELVDRMGHDPEHAAGLVADLIELVVSTEAGNDAGGQEETP